MNLTDKPQRWLLVAVVAVAALVLAAGSLYVTNQRHDRIAEDAEQARTVGTAHVEELLSYDHRNLDAEFEAERDWLTTEFAREYSPLISDTFGPQAKKARLVTEARVVAGGVTRAERHEVDLLLFVNVAVQQKGQQPHVSGSRLQVRLQSDDGEWRISALDPV